MLTCIVAPAARSNGKDGSLLGLFFGGIGDDETGSCALLGCVGPYHDAVIEGLQVHNSSLRG
jgi:hypothetical protein